MPAIRGWFLNFDAAPVSEDTPAGDGGPSQEEQQWKRMRSGDRPGLQNRRAAGNPATGGFDPHSLPPLFKNLQTCKSLANQFGFGRAPVPPWNGGCRWPSVTVRGVPLASIYRSSRHLHELVNRWASIITNPCKFLKAELATRAVNIQVKNRLSQNGSLLDRQLLACHSSENDKFEPSTATEAMNFEKNSVDL